MGLEVTSMELNKKKTSIRLIILMIFVLIVTNIRSNAFSFDNLEDLSQRKNNSNVISEYNGDTLDISTISLETAVDNTCVNADIIDDTTSNGIDVNAVTGSISEISNSSDDNSSIYYVGETEIVDIDNNAVSQGSLFDEGNDVMLSTSTDTDPDYYVENWQELDGELSIMVNKQASCVTVYKGETPIRAMVCSAGESTPEGTFYMQMQWEWLTLIEGQYGRYCSQISGDYLFHSVPYNSMDIYDLDTEMYNQLGTLCSHGCIRLTIEDAKWIYENCSMGTEVTIYNDDNPGPMGKPSFSQIPYEQTWDPTDDMIE